MILYDSIIENISANYAEAADGYRDFLKENADLIKSVFAESRTEKNGQNIQYQDAQDYTC